MGEEYSQADVDWLSERWAILNTQMDRHFTLAARYDSHAVTAKLRGDRDRAGELSGLAQKHMHAGAQLEGLLDEMPCLCDECTEALPTPNSMEDGDGE